MSIIYNKEIKIPYSIIKIALVLTGSLAFVLAGFWILFSNDGLTSVFFQNEVINKIMGIISIAFFGTILVTIPWKLIENKIGIIINKNGIIDRSNLSSIGLIEWDDITEIKTASEIKKRFLFIHTDKPEKYIDKANNRFTKQLLKANHKKYNTPLFITPLILGIRFKELEKLIVEAFEKEKDRRIAS